MLPEDPAEVVAVDGQGDGMGEKPRPAEEDQMTSFQYWNRSAR